MTGIFKGLRNQSAGASLRAPFQWVNPTQRRFNASGRGDWELDGAVAGATSLVFARSRAYNLQAF
ncbi:hypothetical protein [Bradyrhizobium sacchari]|uniref:hypothetical protein n=1 Tax=Bradyrhizobium sacchari TaxID=1399419 RepID=UPI001AECB5A9|nr:hypothetical protein [Bradyrhizobium sacchari]